MNKENIKFYIVSSASLLALIFSLVCCTGCNTTKAKYKIIAYAASQAPFGEDNARPVDAEYDLKQVPGTSTILADKIWKDENNVYIENIKINNILLFVRDNWVQFPLDFLEKYDKALRMQRENE